MSILIFKAPHETNDDQEDPYDMCFKSAGFDSEVVHVIDFEYVNRDCLKDKIKHAENFGGLIFTSPRSVFAVKQCIDGDLKNTEWASLPAYVVGEATQMVLEQQLALTGMGASSGNAENLASYICKNVAGKQIKPLLFPSAEQRRSVLPRTLERNNVPVDIVTSYKTIPHPSLEERLIEKLFTSSCKMRIFIFFSPSGVSAVFPILRNLNFKVETVKIVAIGPSSEQALRDNGQKVFATAEKPSPSSLMECIQLALSKESFVTSTIAVK